MTDIKTTEAKLSSKAEIILLKIKHNRLLGNLRKIAKDIKKDHELALELWSTAEFLPRLLAVLILDKKCLSEDDLNAFTTDMQTHDFNERNNLMDWLFANQLTKDKQKIALIESWANSPFALQRRTFWYYQGRLRWTGKTPPENTEDLLSLIEATITQEQAEVQWAMNFTAGWIGVFDEQYRDRCIELGKRTGLYKDEKVSKGCTPNYLPDYIRIEYTKRQKD